jgi:hypothetical protein
MYYPLTDCSTTNINPTGLTTMSESELFHTTDNAVTALLTWDSDLLLDVDDHMTSLRDELPTQNAKVNDPKHTTFSRATDLSEFEIQCAIRMALPTNNQLPTVVDLNTFFKHKKDFAFPPCYNGLQNQNIITTALNLASCRSGFKLTKRVSKPSLNFSVRIRFQCDHSQVYQRMKNHQNKRKTPTKLPLTKEDACSYGFILRMQTTQPLPVSAKTVVPGQWNKTR